MWSCRACAIIVRFRMYCAFFGTSRPRASSTARTDAMACTVVQTPQKRCVKSHASRGSRPSRMRSMPRHMVADAHAFSTAPLSTSTSMRRCPSIRVIGSMVTRFDICLSNATQNGERLDHRDVDGDLDGHQAEGGEQLGKGGEVVHARTGIEGHEDGVEAVARSG